MYSYSTNVRLWSLNFKFHIFLGLGKSFCKISHAEMPANKNCVIRSHNTLKEWTTNNLNTILQQNGHLDLFNLHKIVLTLTNSSSLCESSLSAKRCVNTRLRTSMLHDRQIINLRWEEDNIEFPPWKFQPY